MTLFDDIINWLIGGLIDLCREIIVELWRHPFPYVVILALLVLALLIVLGSILSTKNNSREG